MFVERLSVKVPPTENRELSFTDKKSAYFYTTTHADTNDMWFAGWNIATRRVLKDYRLWVEDQPLRRQSAQVEVLPYELRRHFPKGKETLFLPDNIEAIVIRLDEVLGQNISIELTGDLTSNPVATNDGLLFVPVEAPSGRILVAPFAEAKCSVAGGRLVCPKNAGGFVFVFGQDEKDALAKLHTMRAEWQQMRTAKMQRMESLVSARNALKTNTDTLDRAIPWLMLTLDQLITRQQGWGIYAGLPWFNQYWGRDMFISMPGACLVNGQYDMARKILLSFAEFQNTDENSPYFGRIPNRAQPTDIQYNTTDGTPRFATQVYDYVRYSGDTSIVRELYPVLRRSMEGSLRYWTNTGGFLTHDDADTWMDAKKEGKVPWSPRGNRANDIQALWLRQLEVSAYFAHHVGDTARARAWQEIAERLKQNFGVSFSDADYDHLADRISPDGMKDFSLRPNQLFALDLLSDEARKLRIVRQVWQQLVYPWGVASLSQNDDNFHPYHEHWHYYHKDAAYHNGTVWLWLNGIAMQRLIEAGQPDVAYRLFENMNRQALFEGAVGSLAENADALPQSGAEWARRSGTFLQAWSNAEHLRVWYQYFLGVQPDFLAGEIWLTPRMPSAIHSLQTRMPVGAGLLDFGFERKPAFAKFTYQLTGIDTRLVLDLPDFQKLIFQLMAGQTVQCIVHADHLTLEIRDANGQILRKQTLRPDAARVARRAWTDALFEGTDFAKPHLRASLRSLQQYHPVPLTY
jgi:glycogen debranching enzyme